MQQDICILNALNWQCICRIQRCQCGRACRHDDVGPCQELHDSPLPGEVLQRRRHFWRQGCRALWIISKSYRQTFPCITSPTCNAICSLPTRRAQFDGGGLIWVASDQKSSLVGCHASSFNLKEGVWSHGDLIWARERAGGMFDNIIRSVALCRLETLAGSEDASITLVVHALPVIRSDLLYTSQIRSSNPFQRKGAVGG